jgi:hypothetical protein
MYISKCCTVTAIATPTYIHMLGNVLQYNSPVIVQMNPDRSNIFIVVKTRLPNIKKYDEYSDIIEPLSNELRTKLTDFPVTIVDVESLTFPSICIYVGVAIAVTVQHLEIYMSSHQGIYI